MYQIIRSHNSKSFQKNMAGPWKSSTIARLVGTLKIYLQKGIVKMKNP